MSCLREVFLVGLFSTKGKNSGVLNYSLGIFVKQSLKESPLKSGNAGKYVLEICIMGMIVI